MRRILHWIGGAMAVVGTVGVWMFGWGAITHEFTGSVIAQFFGSIFLVVLGVMMVDERRL